MICSNPFGYLQSFLSWRGEKDRVLRTYTKLNHWFRDWWSIDLFVCTSFRTELTNLNLIKICKSPVIPNFADLGKRYFLELGRLTSGEISGHREL